MNAESLIMLYRTSIMEREAERARRMDGIRQRAVEKFSANCRTWLGDLWEEFAPGDARVEWDDRRQTYRLVLPLIWSGVNGWIITIQDGRPRRAKLLFRIHDSGPSFTSWEQFIELPSDIREITDPMEYSEVASGPADPMALGELLDAALQAKSEHEEYLRTREEKEKSKRFGELLGAISDSWRNHNYLDRAVQAALEEFPDREGEIRQAEGDVRWRITAAESAAAEQKAFEREAALALERLEQQAEAMFRPFTIYRVTYGARSEGEVDFYTEDCYTAGPEPDENGWWMQLKNGDVRHVMLANVIKVEKIHVPDRGGAPSGVCKMEYLHDEKYGVSTRAIIPPEV